MKRHCCFTLLLLLAGMATSLLGDQPPKSMHPTVQKVVADISDERIAAIMKKLESFGTRNTNALPTADPKKGIVAARQWILEEMKSYSPKLKVRFDSYRLKKSGRLVQDTDLVNVVAELPGTVSPDVLVAISGHSDSMACGFPVFRWVRIRLPRRARLPRVRMRHRRKPTRPRESPTMRAAWLR
jgi:hypothetical protein